MKLYTCFASPEIFYSLACFTFILSGVFGAVVRWCHMCHPYDEHGDDFYPARRQVVFFYAAVSLQFPYVLCPTDSGVWLYLCVFGIIYYPVCFAMLFQRYFRLGRMNRNWHSRLYFFLPLLLLGVMFLMVLFQFDSLIERYQFEIKIIFGKLSLLLSWRFVKECRWLSRRIDEYHTQNFSDESDFPYHFAKKVLYIPLIGTWIMWIVFLTESREVKMVVDLVMAVWMVRFLCRILPPHRLIRSPQVRKELEEMEKKSMMILQKEKDVLEKTALNADREEGTPVDKECVLRQIAEEDWEAVKQEVLAIVSRRYLEPSLKRIDVIHDVTRMKRTLAGTFITQVGFYKLVNAFRVRHYEKLMESSSANVNMSQDIAAELCGFKNRWALANARKRLEDFDYDLIEAYV